MDQTTDWNKIMIQARKALVKSLNDFGCQQTLDFLLHLSGNDLVANELLCLYPKLVSTGNFMARIPVLRKTEMKRSRTRIGNPKRESKG